MGSGGVDGAVTALYSLGAEATSKGRGQRHETASAPAVSAALTCKTWRPEATRLPASNRFQSAVVRQSVRQRPRSLV